MSVGESAVPCHHPSSPQVPDELFASPSSFGCACLQFVVGGVSNWTILPCRGLFTSASFFPSPFAFSCAPSPSPTIDWHNNPGRVTPS